MNDLLDAADRQYVYAVVRRILRSEDVASDATQDTLLLAYRHRDQFRGDSAHRTWLYRIAVTTALGYLRKQRRSREDLAGGAKDLAGDMPDPRPSPEEELTGRQLAARVDAFIETLDTKHREVFVMRTADHPESEIAAALGISIANVKIRAHRARARLRAQLDESQASEPAPRAPRGRQGTRADNTATSRAS